MSKLTLSVDEKVVTRAKRYAARQGTSVSRLVEVFLSLLAGASPEEDEELSPILARLRTELKGVSGDAADYKRYLGKKYR